MQRHDIRCVTRRCNFHQAPVDDKYRTFILPVDEQFKLGVAYGKESLTNDQLSYSLGCSYTWFGDGKIDQTAQGVRAKGEFSSNYAVFLCATLKYTF